MLCLSILHGTDAAAIDPSTGDDEEVLAPDDVKRGRIYRLRDRLGIEYRFRGTINKALLVYDDGVSTNGYFPVDNWGYSSRFALEAQTRQFNSWRFGSRLELGWDPYSTRTISQVERSVDWSVTLRKLEIGAWSDVYGRFYVGQGSMASDGSAEVDLSGTTFAGQSRVERIAGGQLYRLMDADLSDVSVRDTFTNMDGFGRRTRVRYDTPKWNGLRISTAIGKTLVPNERDDLGWDVALRHSGTVADIKFASAIAFSRNFDGDRQVISGSASALHEPSGISATVAAGWTKSEDSPDKHYLYGKLGYQAKWFEIGTTAFSVDAYRGYAINITDDSSVSYGFQFTQKV
ncbi:MAG: hypothetical protein AAGC96_17990, partial [Pseudomonadota bacterium]